MPGLEPDVVVHKLPLKPGYKPVNQRLRRMNSPCDKRGCEIDSCLIRRMGQTDFLKQEAAYKMDIV